jgi:transposase
MLTVEGWTTIRYLHAQGLGVRAISRELGVARKTVRRALRGDGPPKYERPPRPNPQLAPFAAQIRELYFAKRLIGSRILREVRALGYAGSPSAFYAHLKALKALAPAGAGSKVTERFETPPGHQAQFDWSPYQVEFAGGWRRVVVFGMTLGYSRRTHYAASLDETQASVFEAVEGALWHFGGAPKELLVDNPKAFVLDAHPARFRWNPQFLELCGHYRLAPRACAVRRPQTKGKVERPFFYLEQQFIKGRAFRDLAHFAEALAAFEREDLDVRVHATTRERPLDRFAAERPHLTPLPEGRFVGSRAETRKVSWDCLVAFRGSRYSAPAAYAGKPVWLLVSRGERLLVLDARRAVLAEHALSPTRGAMVVDPAHYAGVRQGTPRTYAVLARAFLARFPHHGWFLEALLAETQGRNAAQLLRAVMELATLYAPAGVERALRAAQAHRTTSPRVLRGLLEAGGAAVAPEWTPPPAAGGLPGVPATPVRSDLAAYQRLLEAGR